jgi:RNA polymerase sigma-70 factor (ECF subfamily)
MIVGVNRQDLDGQKAWRALDARLRPFVARRVREADVDDVLQDIFLGMQRGLDSLRDDRQLGAWIYQIARNAIADHHRRASRNPVARSAPPELSDDANEFDDRLVEQEVAAYAALFVETLPEPYREALRLTVLEGNTQKAAAERLGISLPAMKSRVQRGRAMLRDALEQCCHIALDARQRVVGCEPRADGQLPDGCCS